MNPVTLISGFIPLLLFGVLGGPVSAGDAAVIALRYSKRTITEAHDDPSAVSHPARDY